MSSSHTDVEYHEWQRATATIAGRSFRLATKPGVFAYGRTDPATMLLAERTPVQAGDVVVHMNCGNGLFGTVAAIAGEANRVYLTDRNVVSFEASRRTLGANDVGNAQVLLGHGTRPLPMDVAADVVAIRIPTAKLALLQLLWDAFRVLKPGGRCYVAGATDEGIKSAKRTIEQLFGNANVLAYDSGHHLVASVKRSEAPVSMGELDSPYLHSDAFNELHTTLRGRPCTLFSRPGMFSWDHIDEATTILADAMQIAPGSSVLDLGCGCGALGVVAGMLSEHGPVCMVDADSEAVRSATRSATAAGMTNYRALTSDVASAVMQERFDVVVTNPPFHVGKATDLDVPLQFIRDAWEVLAPNGTLFLVANRTLPYERAIHSRFGNVSTLHDGPRFKVLSAVR